MRYLILTDIHANIDALEAIDESYDQLLVLGYYTRWQWSEQDLLRSMFVIALDW